jgi:hypothetical protein
MRRHGSILQVMGTLRIVAYDQWKISMQLMKLFFTLSRMECGVQCLPVGLLDSFPSKTPLTQGAT